MTEQEQRISLHELFIGLVRLSCISKQDMVVHVTLEEVAEAPQGNADGESHLLTSIRALLFSPYVLHHCDRTRLVGWLLLPFVEQSPWPSQRTKQWCFLSFSLPKDL